MFRSKTLTLILILVSSLFFALQLSAQPYDTITFKYSLPFGSDYALDGDTAVVSLYEGTVKVFVDNGTQWVEQATLSPGRIIEEYDQYGLDVAVQGDTAFVTSRGYCPRYDEHPYTPGGVFVFKRVGATWTKQQEVSIDCNAGRSLDVDGNALIVSNEGDYDDYTNSVIFLKYNNTTQMWESDTSLSVDTYYCACQNDSLVALDGDTALAVGESGNEYELIVRVYKRTGGVWAEQTTLPYPIPGGEPVDLEIDLDGSIAVIGNQIYSTDGTTWTLVDTIDDIYVGDANDLGEAVAIEGDRIILGSSDRTSLLQKTDTGWLQTEIFKVNNDIPGVQTANISGSRVLVGPLLFVLNADPNETFAPPTPTSTATTEITPVPTSTLTGQPEPLNANAGFEDGNLAPWIMKKASGDKLVCNTDKVVAHSGNCAFKFKNVEGENGKLMQKLDLAELTRSLPDGLELSLFARTKGGATGSAKVVVRYANGNKQKFGIDIANADGAYLSLSQLTALTQLDAVKAKILVKGTNTQGKFYVDDVVLLYIKGSLRLDVLPLPAN
jgi:hypothetical protein